MGGGWIQMGHMIRRFNQDGMVKQFYEQSGSTILAQFTAGEMLRRCVCKRLAI